MHELRYLLERDVVKVLLRLGAVRLSLDTEEVLLKWDRSE
jgi:hypothetical protein